MNRSEKYRVYIDSNRNVYEKLSGFETISSFMTETIWIDDLPTHFFEIHQEPTFKLIHNQFSFESNRSHTDEGKLSIDKFLEPEKIRTLEFWEYEGEKIYSPVIYGRWDDMWESAKSKAVLTIVSGLLDYFQSNEISAYHEETMIELQKVKTIATFCLQLECELKFFNPNV